VHLHRYIDLLRRTQLTSTFLLTCLSRLGYAALPLCLLFTVRQATGSFTTGALALSVLALCSLSMPVKARLVDRHSQRRVLPLLGLATAMVLGAAAAMGWAQITNVAAWVIVAALVGLSAPPLGPCMRAQWRQAAPNDTQLAYGLDSAAEETVWLLGPVAAGFALALAPAWAALTAIPVLLLVGCFALGFSRLGHERQSDTEHAPSVTGRRSVLRHVAPAAAVMLIFGALTSLVVTGIAARADAIQRLDLAGLAEASVGLGAVIGGLVAGTLPPAGSWLRRIGAVLTGWGGAMIVGAFLELGYASFAAFFLVGLFSAPVWVIVYNAADHMVSEARRTEASTWVSTIANVGASLGTALTGALVALWGPGVAHWSAAALALLAAFACFVGAALGKGVNKAQEVLSDPRGRDEPVDA
jgi:predicted MFS family arabinose efflux permease